MCGMVRVVLGLMLSPLVSQAMLHIAPSFLSRKLSAAKYGAQLKAPEGTEETKETASERELPEVPWEEVSGAFEPVEEPDPDQSLAERFPSIDDIELRKVSLTGAKPQRVAVFAQVANLHLLDDMQRCISNVATAQKIAGSSADVYVSTLSTKGSEQIQHALHKVTGLGLLRVQVAENRGADIGQFLQQLQQASNQSYDVVLKIHTKSSNRIREHMLKHLCGTAEVAQKIIAFFSMHPALGLATAQGFLGKPGMFSEDFPLLNEVLPGESASDGIWWDGEVNAMRNVWPLISGKKPFPSTSSWAIAVTSFFWIRGNRVSRNTELFAAIPSLLNHSQIGYQRGSCCQTPHALERLIPTLVETDGLRIADIEL